jgi:AcrR family transcriptional regulator
MIQKSLTKTKQDKRIFIIETAAKVFAKYGFHKTLMQDISNEAQIGKGTIYEYFTTKEELFFSIYDHWMNDLESIA